MLITYLILGFIYFAWSLYDCRQDVFEFDLHWTLKLVVVLITGIIVTTLWPIAFVIDVIYSIKKSKRI